MSIGDVHSARHVLSSPASSTESHKASLSASTQVFPGRIELMGDTARIHLTHWTQVTS